MSHLPRFEGVGGPVGLTEIAGAMWSSLVEASNRLKCGLKERGSCRAKSDATHDVKLEYLKVLVVLALNLVRELISSGYDVLLALETERP